MINEVCASNLDLVQDEYANTPDWIELYNGTGVAIDLDNYTIADDTSSGQEWVFPSVTIVPGGHLFLFASGLNEVGINLHTSFKLARSGETLILRDDNGGLVDSLVVPALQSNHSYGRAPDGGSFAFFDEPTPGASNLGVSYLGYAQSPEFSITGGFYPSNQNLALSNPNANGEIRFTLDGNLPTDTADLYSTSISIFQATAVSAICIVPGYLDSEVEVNTYFINQRELLPSISITVPPYLMFSDSVGIYAFGDSADAQYPFYGANFWQNWEIPVHFEYYDINKTRQIKQFLGMKIHGGRVSRTNPQRSLRLLAKDRYGDGDVDYPLFPHKPDISSVKRFILRNAGGDFGFAHMRDPLMHYNGLEFGTNVDQSDYHAVAVYINGLYWGIMNLREKLDEHYLAANYQVETDSLDFLEEDTAVIMGSFQYFDTLHQYVVNNDMGQAELYEKVEDALEVNSFMDYFITQLYSNNTDWPQNNLKLWRERGGITF